MTILSSQTIRRLGLIEPMRERYIDSNGCSCGLSIAGYDITLDHDAEFPPLGFTLVSAAERFVMPAHVIGVVHDKSSLARKGLAVQNTVVEPGWCGFLTMEVTNHTIQTIRMSQGSAIAQVLFHLLDEPAERPYAGKYQDQKRGPQSALREDGGAL
jgi:dCTP deaminase